MQAVSTETRDRAHIVTIERPQARNAMDADQTLDVREMTGVKWI